MLVGGAGSSVSAQVASATPDPFIVQLTNTPPSGSGTQFQSFAGDISANGRFVVLESNADIATEKIPTRNPDGTLNPNARNNEDGNREIFLIDYAQRRIFQITNTSSVMHPPASPTPTPSPTPSPSPSPSPTGSPTPVPTPTPTPLPTPTDPSLVQVEISNNRPMISLEPPLKSGKRNYVIVFSSNAPTPGNFNGSVLTTLPANSTNQEIWIYEIPAVADVDLTAGTDLPLINLVNPAKFTQITDTNASIDATPGSTTLPPFVADDNRNATISDDGNIIAFVSSQLGGVANTGGVPQIFFFNRVSGMYTKLTNTRDVFDSSGRLVFSSFNDNPSISADGSVVAFISNGNFTGENDDGNGTGNGEVFTAKFNSATDTFSDLKQVTKTKAGTAQVSVNLLSFGRRLSRNGAVLAFESRATDPSNNGAFENSYTIFTYNLAGATFTPVLHVPAANGDLGFIHFPVFTDYDALLQPSTLMFASFLNFKPDGTIPTTASDGLNPSSVTQVFATQIPATSTNTFTRLTSIALGSTFGGVRAFASNTRKRITFTMGGVELGAVAVHVAAHAVTLSAICAHAVRTGSISRVHSSSAASSLCRFACVRRSAM